MDSRWWKILGSGLVGALLGTAGTIVVDIWRERLRLKVDVTMEVVTWMGEMFRSLNEMTAELDEMFRVSASTPLPKASRFFIDRLPPLELETRVELTFGNDDQVLVLLDELAGQLTGEEGVIPKIVQANQSSWPRINAEVEKMKGEKLAPLCGRIRASLLKRSRGPRWLLRT